jgi:hypothetical protein
MLDISITSLPAQTGLPAQVNRLLWAGKPARIGRVINISFSQID